MQSGKKIYIGKAESAPSVIEKIIQSEDTDVRLYIPRGAVIGHSEHTLTLIKREVEAAGKRVIIESVDDDILTLADAVGFHAINPFFGRERRAVVDVVQRKPVDTEADRLEDEKMSAMPIEDMPEDSGEQKERTPFIGTDTVRTWSFRRFGVATAATLMLVGVIAVAAMLLPRAHVNLTFEHTPWDFDTTLVIDINKQTSAFSESLIELSGIMLSEQRNVAKRYPASDTGSVERKATGKITIYNAYNTNTQALVANTRFEAPDGKIYRITAPVTVPAAKTDGGTIIPQGVDAEVVADEPGAVYNTGPVNKFTIPGFAGSPRFDGFYAVSTTPMTGGYVGETAIPTEADIVAARDAAKTELYDALRGALLLNIPEDIIVAGDMVELSVTDEVIDENVNEAGEFTVTLYGEARAFGFREDDFKALLTKNISTGGKEFVLEEYDIDVADAEAMDFADTRVEANAEIASVWARAFDLEAFKKEAVRKNKEELKALIFSLPGIKSAEVNLWPFWVRTVPEDSDQLSVDVTYKL
jgi:hypothetical protein